MNTGSRHVIILDAMEQKIPDSEQLSGKDFMLVGQ